MQRAVCNCCCPADNAAACCCATVYAYTGIAVLLCLFISLMVSLCHCYRCHVLYLPSSDLVSAHMKWSFFCSVCSVSSRRLVTHPWTPFSCIISLRPPCSLPRMLILPALAVFSPSAVLVTLRVHAARSASNTISLAYSICCAGLFFLDDNTIHAAIVSHQFQQQHTSIEIN